MNSKFDWGSFEEFFEGKQPSKQSMKKDFSAQNNRGCHAQYINGILEIRYKKEV